MLALGDEVSVHCEAFGSPDGSGMDHGCLDKDLRPYTYCPKCRAVGRPDKKLGFVHHTLTDPHSAWPRHMKAANPHEQRSA
ncbi:hypothetical protein GCM10007937_01400 [Mesorhizobium albiziae]|nr:hypothetical protein GCM10007937_01400 [Mesorhizobium albiziae]